MKKITLPISPVPKSRPRFKIINGRTKATLKKTKKVMTYDLQHGDKSDYQMHLMSQMAKERILSPIEGAIAMCLIFHLPKPKNMSKNASKSAEGKSHSKRPDLDNFVKFILDAMNGILYKDDGQIAQLYCEKVYSDNPHIDVWFQPISSQKMSVTL